MGWSCTAAAGTVMDAWTAACRKSSGGSSNTFVGEDGASYFWETDSEEYADGSVTGKVFKMAGSHKGGGGGGTCRFVNSFRIAPDGTVTKTCAFLGKVAMSLAEARAYIAGARGGDGWKRYLGRAVPA